MTTSIHLPSYLFEQLRRRAQAQHQSPEQYLVAYLRAQWQPQHAHIEQVQTIGGVRPFIKGTRIGVDTIVGYVRAGYVPRDLAGDVLPHVTLAQIYDALSYYEDNRTEIDALLAANSPEAWRARLVHELGEQQAQTLLGER